MAFGSLMEVDCQIDISCELEYITKDERDTLNVQISRVAAMLSGMRNRCLEKIVKH